MEHKNFRGKISYISDPDGARKEFGREWWSTTLHEDGQTTLRAYCEIEAGVVEDRSVIRDTTISLDSDYYPLDCYTRVQRSGSYLGSGWFRFNDRRAEAQVYAPEIGRVSQSWPVKVASFGAHNVTCDVLHCARYNHGGEEVQKSKNTFVTNLEHDGCGIPLITPMTFGLEFKGREKVVVPAGSFDADHYEFHLDGSLPKEHPTEHVWCLPENFMFIKIAVGGYMNATFELVELEEG